MNTKPIFQTFVFIGVGLLTTLILLGVKVVFEQTGPGQRLELYGYEMLQSYLPDFASRVQMPVIVLDIGKLEGGTDEHPTPRDKLQDILQALVKTNPKAIALDIDFSPKDEGGWQDDRDPDFFNTCLTIKEEQRIPIFLGVERSIESPPDAWLGLDKYKSLAVGMRFQFPNTNKVILWTRPPDSKEVIPSLSLALAQTYRETLPAPNYLLAPMLEEINAYPSRIENLDQSEFTVAKSLVNYSMLEAIESQSLATVSPTSIYEHKENFKDKLVVIGRIRETRDLIPVIGRDKDIPGVLLQASAVYSLVKFPLYEFTHKARISIDILLPVFLLIFVALIRYRNRKNNDYNWHLKQWIAFIAVIILVFVGGIILVREAGIIWFDFLIVIIGLLIHPLLEKKIGTILSR